MRDWSSDVCSSDLAQISTELNAAGSAVDFDIGPGLGDGSSSSARVLTFTPARSYVSAASMLAPSPDWFVGLHGVQLCDAGQWVDTLNFDAVVYDAGTDSGGSYTATDNPTTPQEPIAEVSGVAAFATAGTTVGSIRISKQAP